MNIFILDEHKELNAQYHCDKHVVKMILEHAQIISSNNWIDSVLGYVPRMLSANERKKVTDYYTQYKDTNLGYKPTHINHPCTIWARESFSNYLYLYNLTHALHKEWKYRYNHPESKVHLSIEKIANIGIPLNMEDEGLTPFAQAMPDKYKSDNAVEAYRNYYIGDKADIVSWKNRDKPYWFK